MRRILLHVLADAMAGAIALVAFALYTYDSATIGGMNALGNVGLAATFGAMVGAGIGLAGAILSSPFVED